MIISKQFLQFVAAATMIIYTSSRFSFIQTTRVDANSYVKTYKKSELFRAEYIIMIYLSYSAAWDN